MAVYYHNCPSWDGKDLLSLYEQHKDEAYLIYADRWPDGGELGQYHVHYVHLHATLDEARTWQEAVGGVILAVNIPDDTITVDTDGLEYPHPIVEDRIPAEYVSRLEE